MRSVVFLLLLLPGLAFAAAGTINNVDSYAWSENLGWINFAPSGGNIVVSDTDLLGYAWSQNAGWINLAPSTGVFVRNDGAGNLSGYAWGEGIGYLDFSGVRIDADGYFQGYATSETSGRVSFNCANTNSCASSDFKVRTDWRPSVSPPASSSGNGTVIGSIVSTLRSAATKILRKVGIGVARTILGGNASSDGLDRSSCPLFLTNDLSAGGRNDGIQVLQLQRFLVSSEHETGLSVTGVYDPLTADAVRRFQLRYEDDILRPLKLAFPTGSVYARTRAKVNALACAPVSGCGSFSSALSRGASGPGVVAMQEFLVREGFLDAALPRGLFAVRTEAALRAFQAAHRAEVLVPLGLSSPTGYWGPATYALANVRSCAGI